jgi:transcriptional regulator with XRE-family HTH domain
MISKDVYLDGAKLKRHRVIKGFSQRGLGAEAGIASSTINLLEKRGRSDGFHPQTLIKLAEALKVEPTDLLGDIEE